MDKKQFFVFGSVIIFLLVVLIAASLLGKAHAPIAKVGSPVVTSTQTSTTTPIQPPVHQVPIWGQYDISPPNTMMLVDSQGRRTGKDPNTGILYREIPNTGYQEIASTPGHLVGELTFSNLPKGQYTLYVLGAQTGPYVVDIANNQGQIPLEGTVQAGSMVAFAQNYDPTNLASSTFSFEANLSSTASITSAPPNNLPAPLTQ